MRTRAAGRPAAGRRWPAGLAWALWTLPMLGLGGTTWLDHLLRQAGRPELATTVGALPPILALISATTVGAVVASRRPGHPVGWLLLALGVTLGINGVVSEYAPYGLLARPGSPPAANLAAQAYPPTALLALTCLGFVLLLTPTGSLPTGSGWRWWARLAAVAPALSLVAAALTPLPAASRYQVLDNPFDSRALSGAALALSQAAFAVALAALVVGAGSLVVRFRRAAGAERQQLRWVALAVAMVLPVGVVVLVAVVLVGPGTAILIGWGAGLFLALPPLAIGAAILRYRLYDLDRIISRTLAYALLTLLLGGAYAGVVLGLGQVLGRGRSLVVAGATLAVAALFQPARGRVQGLVDRRFNRRRYDAAQTIQAFSARLRQQVDLDALRAELLSVVDQTMQPTRVSLWLRPR